MDRLTNILDKTLHMTSTAASRIACRMLELMMASLTNIIPTEMRSSATDYSQHVKDFLPIRCEHPNVTFVITIIFFSILQRMGNSTKDKRTENLVVCAWER